MAAKNNKKKEELFGVFPYEKKKGKKAPKKVKKVKKGKKLPKGFGAY